MTYEQLLAALNASPRANGVRGVVGLDEILGADGVEAIIGAVTGGGDLAAAAAAKAAGGVAVATQNRGRQGVQPAAFAPTAILAAGQATINLQTQRLIRPKSLVSLASDNGLFFLTALTVADVNQFISAGSIPTDVFSEVADGMRTVMKLSSADVGNTISMNVTNRDAVNAHTFTGCFFCTAVFQ